jgi:hypothetical protein
MLLSRVTAHFRKQEWTAIAIDFVIVVVGVFVGIQVSNLNAARIDRGLAASHLRDIAEDLQSHLDLQAALYGSAVARVAAVDYIYGKAFGRTLPKTLVLSVTTRDAPPTPEIPEDQLDNILGWINTVRSSPGSRHGYESLISSGHLGLLENRALARKIQKYYDSYDDLLVTQTLFRQFRDQGVVANWAHGMSVFDERPVGDVIALARENEDFAAYLRTMREWAVLHAGLLEDLRVDTEALLTDIRAELERLS